MASLLGIEHSEPIQVNELFSLIEIALSKFVKVEDLHVSKILGEDATITRRGEEHEFQIDSLI